MGVLRLKSRAARLKPTAPSVMGGWGQGSTLWEIQAPGLGESRLGQADSCPQLHQGSGPTLPRAHAHGLLLLQFVGRYETIMFYWPSLLCLAFLLGRFLHMFVKSLRVYLGWELPTVSTTYKHCVCPDSCGLHNSAVK